MTTTQVRRIDEVAAVFNGKTPSKSEQRGSGHPVLKIKDVDALGKFRGTFSGHVGADLAQKHVKQQLAGGETLVLNAAHSVTHVASKTFYADQEVAGSLATGEWLIIRWCTESVDSRFGNHWINAPDTRFRIRRLVNGIHLYPKDVARLQIPLPPLDEQKRIAGILDAADALRAKRREALAELDTLLQSTFLDMFGDPVTNPMGWEMVNGGRVSRRLTVGIVIKPASYYQPTGVPAIRSLNVRTNKIEIASLVYVSAEDNEGRLKKTRVWKDDVLLVRSGQPGTAAVVPAELDGVNAIDILILTPDQHVAHPVYLSNYYNSAGGKRMVLGAQRGQIQKHLNLGSLRSAPIPLPPLNLQHRFAAIVAAIEQQKATQRAHLAELDALFASLQSRAFRGSL